MLRMILKLLVLPVYLVLCFLCGVMDVVLRLYSFGAGIFYLFLFVCLILALISNQWVNLAVLSGFLLGTLILTVFIGVVGAAIEIWKDRVKGFVFF